MSELLNRAMRILAQRDHSEHELRRKLAAQSFSKIEPVDQNEIERVITYCYEYSWLDDEKFAFLYLKSRSQKGYGAQRIQSELLQKGIERSAIHAIFSESDIDWGALAKKLALKRFGTPLPSEWAEKAKIQRFLLYRGFFQEDIQTIFHDFAE